MGNKWQSQTIQDAATTTGDGTIVQLGDANSLVVTVYGTSTSFSITFKTALTNSFDATQWSPIAGIRQDTQTYTSTASVLSTSYVFDVSKWGYFKAQITAISDGNVSVSYNTVMDS